MAQWEAFVFFLWEIRGLIPDCDIKVGRKPSQLTLEPIDDPKFKFMCLNYENVKSLMMKWPLKLNN